MSNASRKTLGAGSWALEIAERRPRKRARAKGQGAFTLVEAVAAIALVGIGVTSVLSGLATVAKTDRLLLERGQMQRMALRKYDEIVATGLIDSAELSGDFAEENIEGYEWAAEVEPTGEENLEILTVTVNRSGDSEGPQATIDGLVFRPPIQGGAQ